MLLSNVIKCTKFDFGWGCSPDRAGAAYSAPPDPIAGFEGPTSRGRERRKDGTEGQGRGKKGGGLFLRKDGRR